MRIKIGPVMALAAVATISVTAVAAADAVGHQGASVRQWAQNLAGPQGLATDGRGGVYVVENTANRVTRFSRDGAQSVVYVKALKSPSWALYREGVLYVAEREGNSIARVSGEGTLTRLAGEVVDPLGLAVDPKRPGSLLAVSHRQSLIHRFALQETGQWALLAEPEVRHPAGVNYGWRDLAVDAGGVLYLTDEATGAILRRLPGGELQPWVTGLSAPSGLALGPDGGIYVTEEGNGRLSYVSRHGKIVMVAEGLGKAREVLPLDDRTLLVSDRAGGVVWQVQLAALPK